MPLHKLPLTFADYASLVTSALFLIQPGVDRAIWGIFTLTKLIEYSCLAYYYTFYSLQIPWFEKHRSYPNKANWPWNHPSRTVRELVSHGCIVLTGQEYKKHNCAAWAYVLKFHIGVTAFTWALGKVAFPTHTQLADPRDDWRMQLMIAETMPGRVETAIKVYAAVLLADFGGYWVHRLLHTKYFYWAHKQHHEFKSVNVLTTFYVHPVEVALYLLLAGVVFGLFKMHLYQVWMYVFCNTLMLIWSHCGYELPLFFNPLLVLAFNNGNERCHDIHHRSPLCNYGAEMIVWDRLFNTYKDPDVYAREHPLKETANSTSEAELTQANGTAVNGHKAD